MNRSFVRKVIYAIAIAVLLAPLSWLGQPASRDSSGKEHPGGVLAKYRKEQKLSQANLGEIDPASETMKLATLGMQGIAASVLWNQAIEYKKTEDWTNLAATLAQLSKLQPNFIKVWEFQGWNLAYNVSVEFDDYKDRYRWVVRGVNYLKEGIQYNEGNPALLWYTGWVIGQKMGRSDEKVLFRRMFKDDDDFHADAPHRRPEDRDNWLVGKEWYQKANDSVDRGQSLKNKSPLVFFSDVPMSQMNYAEALQDDGVHGDVAEQAWIKAAEDWNEYGLRPILTSGGRRIRLNEKERKEEDAVRYRAELEQLVPGARDVLYKAKYDLLSKEERDLLAIPPQERNAEQQGVAFQVELKLNIPPAALADYIQRVEPEKTREAMRLAHLAGKAFEEQDDIDRYRQIVNFDYWRTRARMEQSPAALLARQRIYEAEQAYRRKADLVSAKRLYEEGFQQWRIAIDKFPMMREAGTLPEELVDVVVAYKEIYDLTSTETEFPQDFILRDVIENRDQENKLRGFFHAPRVPSPTRAAQPPEEGRPPEPKDDPKDQAAPPQSQPEPAGELPSEGRPPEPPDETATSPQPSESG